MGQIIQLDNPVTVIQQQKQEVSHEDLDIYRKLGVLQTFIIQGDDDEECETKWMQALGLSPEDTIYAVEAGAALEEVRELESKQDNRERAVLGTEGVQGL